MPAAGNTRSNLREDAHRRMAQRGTRCRCIRCREVRGAPVDPNHLIEGDLAYEAGGGTERFLSLETAGGRLAGYLRLRLPGAEAPDLGWPDLERAAIVRDLHVYGQTLPLGENQAGAAQHRGLGTELVARAEAVARGAGFRRLAVISAIGTRDYYRQRGFEDGELYQVKTLG